MSAGDGPPQVKSNAWVGVQPGGGAEEAPGPVRRAKTAFEEPEGGAPLERGLSRMGSEGPQKTGLLAKRRETAFFVPSAKRAKWVINPEKSRFMQKWDMVTMMALFFVAVGT